jgi:hypothetical protein
MNLQHKKISLFRRKEKLIITMSFKLTQIEKRGKKGLKLRKKLSK